MAAIVSSPRRLGRRLLMLRLGVAAVPVTGAEALAQVSLATPQAPNPPRRAADADPTDSPSRGIRPAGRTASDNDPSDAPGRGIRPAARPASDNDPSDGPGGRRPANGGR
jgi:hypothetical protein